MSLKRTMRSAVLLAAFALVACSGGASGGSDQASNTAADTKTQAEPADAKPVEKPMAEPEAKAPESMPATPLSNPKAPEMNETAPDTFDAKLETSKGDIVVHVTRAWAPQGADRFYNLVKNGYYNDVRFFRVIAGFMAQFGISGDPSVGAAWREAKIMDDPVTQSNTRGMVTFATSGPNTRTTQLFINFGNNAGLDGQGFAPFGKVDEEGMKVVDALFADYGEGAPRGAGPNQMRIQSEGNKYLSEFYPNLDYIKKAVIVSK